MKKQFSLALLTLSIFSINLLPAQATTKSSQTQTESKEAETVLGEGLWCFEIPQMGLFCIDL